VIEEEYNLTPQRKRKYKEKESGSKLPGFKGSYAWKKSKGRGMEG
jgi:hypothetical protein